MGGLTSEKITFETLFYITNMINVGFIEKILFRGFLFEAIEKESVQKAIIISTLTFGIGHIVNLFNGQDTLNTIIQIIYALSLGYLFVMIFYKSNSLVPCIITLF